MTTKDFQIGNYIIVGNKIVEIRQLNLYTIGFYYEPSDTTLYLIKPEYVKLISINDELLEKNNFIKDKDGIYYNKQANISLVKKDNYYYFKEFGINIYYVHELQQLMNLKKEVFKYF